MRKHIPGLHSGHQDLVSNLDGLFLVRVERASYRWHPQKPFFALRFSILEPITQSAARCKHRWSSATKFFLPKVPMG